MVKLVTHGREGLQKNNWAMIHLAPEAAAPHLQCDRGSGEAESEAVFFTFENSFFSHFLAVISRSDHRSEVFLSCAGWVDSACVACVAESEVLSESMVPHSSMGLRHRCFDCDTHNPAKPPVHNASIDRF